MTTPAPKLRVRRLHGYEDAIAQIDAIRERRGISVFALARSIGARQNETALWLQGRRKPAAHRVFEMADALGLDLALVSREAGGLHGAPQAPVPETGSWCHCVEQGYPGPHRRSEGCEGDA